LVKNYYFFCKVYTKRAGSVKRMKCVMRGLDFLGKNRHVVIKALTETSKPYHRIQRGGVTRF
jgi:hypothetical protein